MARPTTSLKMLEPQLVQKWLNLQLIQKGSTPNFKGQQVRRDRAAAVGQGPPDPAEAAGALQVQLLIHRFHNIALSNSTTIGYELFRLFDERHCRAPRQQYYTRDRTNRPSFLN
ncbi:hypothetical protein CDAR_443521 [Caerostris darwini]|uniref:Uncharacterized protein n=1 Tax=Caerostris darwini TaxID=1538125 RepID=A0AAV4R2Y8_9ARAC|nr:hypothetical protein CDAR_443521 [Caerostris darwini]